MRQNSLDATPANNSLRSLVKWVVIAFLIIAVLIGAAFAWQKLNNSEANASLDNVATLSAAEFEEQYGMSVRLIGVTAGGGLVDFRLKVLDVAKAQQVLSDPAKMPRLVVPDKNITLVTTPNEDQDLSLTEGGIYFVLFSNTSGAVEPGTPVIVSFGDFQLEPIPAQ